MDEAAQRRGDEVGDGGRPPPEPQRAEAGAVRTVDARELLGARGLLHIAHEGETYTLRLTRNNRLILTK